MNAFLGRIRNESPSGVRFFAPRDILNPGVSVLYVDGRALDTPSRTTGNSGGKFLFSATEIYTGLRHSNGANVMFIDGHGSHIHQPIREMNTGYRGWFNGENGPHDLVWRHEE
jgi:prepilin-type processing-associated H-X9-DG protein